MPLEFAMLSDVRAASRMFPQYRDFFGLPMGGDGHSLLPVKPACEFGVNATKELANSFWGKRRVGRRRWLREPEATYTELN
jgi:hypothetical protein